MVLRVLWGLQRVTERQMPQAVTLAYSSLLVGILAGPPLAALLYTSSTTAAFFASGKKEHLSPLGFPPAFPCVCTAFPCVFALPFPVPHHMVRRSQQAPSSSYRRW